MPSSHEPERAPLSREGILAAALRLVDREGLEALTMRRLGAEIGVEAMSLYHHVSSKAAVLDGLHEAILAEMPPLGGEPDGLEALRGMARGFARVLGAHPRALPLFATRPAVTPASLRHVETALAVLERLGLGPDESVSAFQVLVTFVVGHALSRFAPAAGGEVSPARYEDLPPAEFPRLSALAAALATHDPEAELELGLDLFLGGLRARLRR